MAMTGNQMKAARALAGLDQKALADQAGVNVNTIRNMEASGLSRVRVRTDTLDAVEDAFKALGVLFIAENGEGPGVRLRKRRPMVNPVDGTLEGYTVAPEKPDDP